MLSYIPRILIVDDTPEVAEMVALILRQGLEHAECRCARGGEEAIQLYFEACDAGAPFDLLILDLAMPGVSGIDVVERIRASGDQVTKMAFLTAYNDMENRTVAILLGVEGPWLKPITAGEICGKVVACLEG